MPTQCHQHNRESGCTIPPYEKYIWIFLIKNTFCFNLQAPRAPISLVSRQLCHVYWIDVRKSIRLIKCWNPIILHIGHLCNGKNWARIAFNFLFIQSSPTYSNERSRLRGKRLSESHELFSKNPNCLLNKCGMENFVSINNHCLGKYCYSPFEHLS